MKSRIRTSALVAATAATLLLSGVGGALAVGGKPAVNGNALVIALPAEPGNLDPQVAASVDSAKYAWNVFDTLYGFDRSGKLEPRLATSYEVSEDGLHHAFKLRGNVKFHNSAPLTADDVMYSLQRIIDPVTKSTRRPYFASLVESVEAPDPTSVVVHLKKPDGAFLNKVAGYLYIVPKAYTQALPSPRSVCSGSRRHRGLQVRAPSGWPNP